MTSVRKMIKRKAKLRRLPREDEIGDDTKAPTVEHCLQQQFEEKWESECLISEVNEKLSQIDENINFKIPDFFRKCHAKRSIILVVEGRQIFASKQILKLASPVFHSMFESDFLEKDKESIELPGKTCQEIILLLSCIYPNILDQIEDDEQEPPIINIKSLSPAARRAADRMNYYSNTCVQVANCFGTAEELRIFFRKLNVTWITVHIQSGTGRILFEDGTSALCAYCMDGELFKGKPIYVTYSPEFELSGSEDARNNTSKTDLWMQTNYCLTVQDKLPLLLKLADEYQIDSVLRLCDERYLMMYQQQSKDTEFSEEKLVELLLVAEEYQLQTTLQALINSAVKNMKLKKIEECERFEDLTLEVRYKIVNAKLSRFKERRLSDSHRSRELPPMRRRIRRQYQSNDCSAFFLSGESPLMTLRIKVGSNELFASKEVMALSSPVFHKRIRAFPKDIERVTLKFEDQDFDDFFCLLKSVHPGTMPDITEDNIQRLLDLAYTLEVDKLAEDCDEFLDNEFNKVMSTLKDKRSDEKEETATKYLNKAAHYVLPQLLDSSCEYLCQSNVENLNVSKEIKLKIISKRVNDLENIYSDSYYYRSENKTATCIETQKVMEVKGNPLTIHSFRKMSEYDVRLVVHGKGYYADEDVLSIASPVLKHKLQSADRREDKTTISLDMNEKGLLLILRCIYPNILKRVTELDAVKLLTFAEAYGMTSLRNLCERSLVKHCQASQLSSSTVIDYITKASLFQMPRLKQACEGVLRKVYGEKDPKEENSVDLTCRPRGSKSTLRQLFVQESSDDDYYDDYNDYLNCYEDNFQFNDNDDSFIIMT